VLLGPAPAPAQAPPDRLDGEYGLWVEVGTEQLEVHWITARVDSGLVRLRVGGREESEAATPPSLAHHAALPWRGEAEVELEYGSATDMSDVHRTTVALRPPRRQGTVFPAVDSLFVVADVHGEYDRLRHLLSNAGLVDGEGRWSGGHRQLVFLGDLVDRGPDATRTLWFVYGLERQARAAGGRVLVLLGNHEVMAMTGDLRYTAPKEQRIAAAYGVPYARLLDPDSSVLGRWLASKPVLLRMGKVLLVHGGATPAYLGYSLPALDDSLASYVHEELFTRWSDTTFVPPLDSASYARRYDLFWGERSPLWARGYLQTDTLGATLERTLDGFGARLMVVGHTPMQTMEVRYGGKLIAAHPRLPAQEMLLLVRGRGGFQRYRYGLTGPPEPF
jgi:hypothetical protein